MAANLYRAAVGVSLPASLSSSWSAYSQTQAGRGLDGLVYGATILPKEDPVPFYKNVWLWAILAVCIFATLNILFW